MPGPEPSSESSPPPWAFTQGVGTVFQVAGVTLFIVTMGVCCLSSLLGKETAERQDLTHVGWRLPGGHFYSAPRAMSVSVVVGLALGLGVASAGLGLQAVRRSAPPAAVLVTVFGLVFWGVQAAFAALVLHSYPLTAGAVLLTFMFASLSVLAIGAGARCGATHPLPTTGYCRRRTRCLTHTTTKTRPRCGSSGNWKSAAGGSRRRQREVDMLEAELRRKQDGGKRG